jgi:DtxR family transcriptional regulator, Mn-dependent transcriptional regulator
MMASLRPVQALTSAAEDYLKGLYELSRGEQAVTTSALADRLGIAAPSVTGMLKRLAERGLVERVPYYGARLTEPGRREALRVIRRHRVLELFLVQVLGYPWDRVHEEAERLEHAATDELIDRMAKTLGEPELDPHGAPIPSEGAAFEDRRYPSLWDLSAGERGVVRRVSDHDAALLRYLEELGLVPGVELEVVERAPFGGPLRVRVGRSERVVGRELSREVEVEAISTEAQS